MNVAQRGGAPNRGKAAVDELDLSDEEINETHLKSVGDSSEYVQKLQRLVQLTGYSDPVYAESFVNFHKFDIQFEILLVNRTQKPIQHISVEFFTQGDQRIVENAPILTLQPNACTTLKTSMKFSS